MLTTISTANANATAGPRTQASQLRGSAGASRKRARSRESKYGDGSGACHSSRSAIVRRIDSNSWAQLAQELRCSSIPDPELFSIASSRCSRASLQVITPPLQELLQFHPQCLVGAEQQRFCRRFAQLEHFSNLLVVHALIFVHKNGQPLSLWQRINLFTY